MNEAKKHHFVPQAYLNFFAKETRANKYRIGVYDKIENKFYCRNVADVAEIRDYNRIGEMDSSIFVVPENNPLFYEEYYSELIEKDIPGIIRDIQGCCILYNYGKTILDSARKNRVAKMIAIQILRTQKVRDYLFQVVEPVFYRTKERLKNEFEELPYPHIRETNY